MALRRREGGGGSLPDWRALALETFVWDYPCCLEFLCCSEWEPGAARVPGTIMLMLDGTLWKLWAHDRDSHESLFVSGATVQDALQSLERCLADGSGEWRHDRSNGAAGPRKRS